MTRYYKTGADRKPQEISKQEADKMVERNQDIFNQVLNGADFSKLLEKYRLKSKDERRVTAFGRLMREGASPAVTTPQQRKDGYYDKSRNLYT